MRSAMKSPGSAEGSHTGTSPMSISTRSLPPHSACEPSSVISRKSPLRPSSSTTCGTLCRSKNNRQARSFTSFLILRVIPSSVEIRKSCCAHTILAYHPSVRHCMGVVPPRLLSEAQSCKSAQSGRFFSCTFQPYSLSRFSYRTARPYSHCQSERDYQHLCGNDCGYLLGTGTAVAQLFD